MLILVSVLYVLVKKDGNVNVEESYFLQNHVSTGLAMTL